MRLRSNVFLLGLFTTSAYCRPASEFQDKCKSLSDKIQLDYTFDVNVAEYLPPSSTIDLLAEGLNATCSAANGVSALSPPVGVCRFNLRVSTSENSEVYMEVWLPENWEGRTLMTGNGGLDGCIRYNDLAYGASHGFASFGTNNGHNGTSGGALFRQPDVLEDYTWRSVYTGAVVGKSITQQFYDSEGGKNFYLGCSTGGRQGWKAIQKDPELFDGVIAGAPVVDLWAHVAFFGYTRQLLGFFESSVTLQQWTAVQQEVLNQCDGLDGAHDGILENPGACVLDWTSLICPSASNSTCLTSDQADAVAKLFNPVTYNGTFLYPGENHGNEVNMIYKWLYSSFVLDWIPETFQYIVYEDLSWDPTSFTLADALYALEQNKFNLNTFDGDISAFRDRGGKVLHWHGTGDGLITSKTSDLYYENVRSMLNATVAELDEFYRYFRASGVDHCGGGPGAWSMGQGAGATTGDAPDDNMLLRIVKWVEQGEAPEFVRGTKYVNDTAALGVKFTRKHCKYPKVNIYTGDGEGVDESGWECIEP